MDPARTARKWKSELQLATRRERDWRDASTKIIKKYRGEERKKNGFNILWANTEILRPAIYNSRPNPDVRRRFRDEDPLGKAISEVVERCLHVVVDDYSTDCALKNDVLDALLPGRGVSRIRYVPKITQTPVATGREQDDPADDDAMDSPEVEEELTYEQCRFEHVDWEDLRHGYGRVWDEVAWIAFRCKISKEEAQEKFGEDAVSEIKFTPPDIPDEKKPNQVATETELVAEFWEVWDKNSKTVFFVQQDALKPLYPLATPKGEPPIDLEGFFPIPEPLKIIENTGSLTPIPIFQLYEQQANELDRISIRINKIVDACKLRGVYDSTLTELGDLLKGEDNDLTPVAKAGPWAQKGGLDAAITWMPTDSAAKVLEILGAARDQSKQIIYEITGISDIIRGASMASETATAQQIKANYASVRLKRMQAEVQRYVRDLLRIAAEVISNKFEQPTLAQMTNLQFPTEQQKQMALMQAQATGQPPPPDLANAVTWEQIIQAIRDDRLRSYKIDVETDSTVAGSLEGDMQGLSEVVTAIGGAMQVFAPLVQGGFMPVEAAKEIVLSITRRAKMGISVEDALEKIQQPPPPPQEQQPQDHSLEVAQINAQKDAQIAQLQTQHEKDLEGARLQAEAAKQQSEQQLEQMRLSHEQSLEQMRLETQRMIADAANQTNLMIADMKGQQAATAQANQLAADQQKQQTQIDADSQKQAVDTQSKADLASMKAQSSDAPPAADYKAVESDPEMKAHLENITKMLPIMKDLATKMTAPRKLIRDANGRAQASVIDLSGIE